MAQSVDPFRAYIAMAFIVMAYMVMARIVIACTVMARSVDPLSATNMSSEWSDGGCREACSGLRASNNAPSLWEHVYGYVSPMCL